MSTAHRVIDDGVERTEAMQAALMRSTVGGTELDDRARALEGRFQALHDRIAGVESREMANDPGPVTVERRLGVAFLGNFLSTYGPTPMHERQVEIAREEYAEIKAELEGLVDELAQLEADLDAAGVPWTPGRGLMP